VEEGLMTGDVMFHEFVKKPDEAQEKIPETLDDDAQEKIKIENPEKKNKKQ
jgi:hypothetical protein